MSAGRAGRAAALALLAAALAAPAALGAAPPTEVTGVQPDGSPFRARDREGRG